MRKSILFFVMTVVLLSGTAHGIMIANFPGLDGLIREADAIVILRIEKRLSDYDRERSYATYECYIYQTLKGEIPINQRIRLQLMDARFAFVPPFSDNSTHLVFLGKNPMPDSPAEYRSLMVDGANIRISPFGNEKMPEGKTVKAQIQTLLAQASDYNRKQYEKEQRFLDRMREGSGASTMLDLAPPEIPDPVRNYLEKELGLSSTGELAVIGRYRLTGPSALGQKDDPVLFVVQQDLFGSRLFWSCLVNLTGNKVQILYQAATPDRFGTILDMDKE